MRIIEKDTQSRRIISQKTIDRVIRIFTFTFFLIVCFLTTGGQKIIVDSKKEKTVTVKGRVVAFQVLKPDFWKATIDPYSGYTEYSGDNEVVHYQSVIEIYKNKLNGVDSGGVTIEVKNIEKYGKPLTEVFQKQIQEYEVKFAKMEKEEIAVKNSKYESVSTLMHSTNPNSSFRRSTCNCVEESRCC